MGALKVKHARWRAEYLGLKLLCMQDTEPVRAIPACRLCTATQDSSSGYGRSSPHRNGSLFLLCFALISTNLGLGQVRPQTCPFNPTWAVLMWHRVKMDEGEKWPFFILMWGLRNLKKWECEDIPTVLHAKKTWSMLHTQKTIRSDLRIQKQTYLIWCLALI